MRILFVLLVGACLPAALLDKPDYSGTWELNLPKSDYAWQRPPRSVTQWVEHKEPALMVETYHVDEDGSEVR